MAKSLVEQRAEAVIGLARRVVSQKAGSSQQKAAIELLRASLADLDAAELCEGALLSALESAVATESALFQALDAVPVTDRDARDLDPVVARVPDLAEQLAGLGALHRTMRDHGLSKAGQVK